MLPQPISKTVDDTEFHAFITNICDLFDLKDTAIIIQWYSTARKFRIIDKFSMYELFSAKDILKGMKMIILQNLRAVSNYKHYQK